MPIYTLSISHSFPIYIYIYTIYPIFISNCWTWLRPWLLHQLLRSCRAGPFPPCDLAAAGRKFAAKVFLYNGTDSQILGLGVSMSWSLGFKRKQISKQPPFYFLPQSIHGSGTAVIRCDKSLNPNFNAWQHATHTVLAIMKRFEVIWSK